MVSDIHLRLRIMQPLASGKIEYFEKKTSLYTDGHT